MQDFKRLQVWHKAHACFLAVHKTFAPGRGRSVAGLRAQLIRAAASIATNIAEGCGKSSTREFLRFLEMAVSSAREVENHLIVARDLEVISQLQFTDLDDLLTEVRRMLIGLMRALRQQPPRGESAAGG
jgi:four helix bundle protein